MLRTTATVHPIDFSQLSGQDFERLVFAFLCRRWSWSQIDWFGQVGNDGGRDIWGIRENDWGRGELVVVACANWRRLTAEKATTDIDKVLSEPKGLPTHLIVVAGGKVSADLKTKIQDHAHARGVQRAEVWSGPELEELMRHHAASVLKRFFDGEAMPDEAQLLVEFVADTRASDEEGLRMLGRLFDRPAFYTPFHSESSLPDFRRAISDTIEALNTGIYRSRDGTLIGRVPAKNDFADTIVRGELDAIVRMLNRLRVLFDEHLTKGTIKPCGCNHPNCHTFMVDHGAAHELDRARREILLRAQRVLPGFRVKPDY